MRFDLTGLFVVFGCSPRAQPADGTALSCVGGGGACGLPVIDADVGRGGRESCRAKCVEACQAKSKTSYIYPYTYIQTYIYICIYIYIYIYILVSVSFDYPARRICGGGGGGGGETQRPPFGQRPEAPLPLPRRRRGRMLSRPGWRPGRRPGRRWSSFACRGFGCRRQARQPLA